MARLMGNVRSIGRYALFKRLKGSPESRLFEEQIYAQVVEELTQGKRRDGLWARAIAESEAREDKAKSLYIRYRVQSIKDEIKVSEKARKAEEERQATTRAIEEERKKREAQAKREADSPVFDGPMTVANWFWLFLFLGVMFSFFVLPSLGS